MVINEFPTDLSQSAAMPPEVLALIDRSVLLVAVLFVGAQAGMAVEQIVSKQRRAEWRRRNAWRWEKKGGGRRSPSLQGIGCGS